MPWYIKLRLYLSVYNIERAGCIVFKLAPFVCEEKRFALIDVTLSDSFHKTVHLLQTAIVIFELQKKGNGEFRVKKLCKMDGKP